MQWVSHSQTSSSKQRMCATQKPQLVTDPNHAKPLCKTNINQRPCPEIEACNLLGGPELFRAQRGLTRGLLLRGKDARGSFIVVQVIPSQSSGTCCLTATTKCAGFPHIFSDLLHQQKGCSWFVDRMKHVNAGPPDPGDVPESEAPRAWWLSSASLASKGLGSRMSSSHRSGRCISRICKVSALVELPSHETAYSMFDEGANKLKGHFILGTSCSCSGWKVDRCGG